jgi:type I restriction enzyme S subunit
VIVPLHRFRPFVGYVSPEYAQLPILCLQRHVPAAASLTVNIAHLTLVRLKPWRFPLAPRDEQAEIVRRVRAAFDRLGLLQVAANEIDEHRVALDRAVLSKAFRGELVASAPRQPSEAPRVRRTRSHSSAKLPHTAHGNFSVIFVFGF